MDRGKEKSRQCIQNIWVAAVVKTIKRHLRSWTIFDFKTTPIRKKRKRTLLRHGADVTLGHNYFYKNIFLKHTLFHQIKWELVDNFHPPPRMTLIKGISILVAISFLVLIRVEPVSGHEELIGCTLLWFCG